MYIQTVEKTNGYEYESVKNAVFSQLEALKIASKVNPETKILLKPNLVTDSDPFFSKTTHPAVIRAVADFFLENGAKNIMLADSPGGYLSKMPDFDFDEFYVKTGLSQLEPDIKLNRSLNWSSVQTENGFSNKSFNLLNAVVDADYIVNIPKLKTHNSTVISFGIKNLFGCIPDVQKPMFHLKYPKMPDFCNMLIELALTVKPSLTVVDAVDIMEGNGPVTGIKRRCDLIFCSEDVFSQDNFIAEYFGVDTSMVDMLVNAKNRGLIKTARIISKTVHDAGAELPIELPDTCKTDEKTKKLAALVKVGAKKVENALFAVYPKVNVEKCVACRRCEKSCPANAITVTDHAVIDYGRCINCLCCNEFCSENAVDVKKVFKGRKR